ncbi:PilZ domain-containing protein [Novosphingobium piscinae]|uniref:PilZ domain-containing protein n=2 Tax=Novosphingobium piscinae TaxID=1507448 RepID=A0A7X1G2F8_9SPHN|nr:PilZ domain-containing protein [Novosphingobium piscinae]
MPARCRMVSGFVEDVVIRDISAEGCRIMSLALNLRPGTRVVVRPAGMEGLCGTVRWSGHNEAGIEFERPLHPAVAEHMHRSFATFLPPEVPYRPSGVRPLAA